MSTRIEHGSLVVIAYRLTDLQGQVLEERTPESPLSFVQGQGELLPAVEAAILGKKPNETVRVELTPDKAYGQYHADLIGRLPRDSFPENVEVRVGMKFNTLGPTGEAVVVRAIEVSEDEVVLDGNHPLAGIHLVFEVRVLEVRKASGEEILTSAAVTSRGQKLH